MDQSGIERRRLPRVAVDERRIVLKTSISTQVLDLGRGGMLLGSPSALSIGDQAELVTTIGAESFAVPVEIRHVSIDPQRRGGVRYRAGAAFAGAGERDRMLLDRLLGAESR